MFLKCFTVCGHYTAGLSCRQALFQPLQPRWVLWCMARRVVDAIQAEIPEVHMRHAAMFCHSRQPLQPSTLHECRKLHVISIPFPGRLGVLLNHDGQSLARVVNQWRLIVSCDGDGGFKQHFPAECGRPDVVRGR